MIYVIYFIKFPLNSISNNNYWLKSVTTISTLNWNPIPDVIFPGRKSVIYDSGRIIWVFTQIEIKFYIYNSNNCSIFVWKGKSSWNIFLFVINNFRIIFHWLSIISTIYILFIYCRHCFRLYNRFSVSYFSQRKKESSEDEIHSNEKFHSPNFERGSLKRATFPITKWLPIIRLLALLYLDSIANFFFFFFS